MTKFIDLGTNLRWEDAPLWGNKGFVSVASFAHLLTGYLLYIILNRWIQKVWISCLVLMIFHIVEDFVENVKIGGYNLSIEGLYSKMIGCKNENFLDVSDNDSLQNFIGDNVFFAIGLIIGVISEKYTCDVSIWVFISAFIGMLLIYMLICYYLKSTS